VTVNAEDIETCSGPEAAGALYDATFGEHETAPAADRAGGGEGAGQSPDSPVRWIAIRYCGLDTLRIDRTAAHSGSPAEEAVADSITNGADSITNGASAAQLAWSAANALGPEAGVLVDFDPAAVRACHGQRGGSRGTQAHGSGRGWIELCR
jgi:hypothetical protein